MPERHKIHHSLKKKKHINTKNKVYFIECLRRIELRRCFYEDEGPVWEKLYKIHWGFEAAGICDGGRLYKRIKTEVEKSELEPDRVNY